MRLDINDLVKDKEYNIYILDDFIPWVGIFTGIKFDSNNDIERMYIFRNGFADMHLLNTEYGDKWWCEKSDNSTSNRLDIIEERLNSLEEHLKGVNSALDHHSKQLMPFTVIGPGTGPDFTKNYKVELDQETIERLSKNLFKVLGNNKVEHDK